MARNYVDLPADAARIPGFPYFITPGVAGQVEPRIYRKARNAEPQYLEVRSRFYDNAHEYPFTMLCVKGKRYKLPIHRLLAITFLGPCPGPGYQVAHTETDLALLRDPSLLAVDGSVRLRWDTPENNRADSYRLGTVKTYPEEVKEWARGEWEGGKTMTAIAEALGVSRSSVRCWILGRPLRSAEYRRRRRRKLRKRVWFHVWGTYSGRASGQI